jgi:hypothetical protein
VYVTGYEVGYKLGILCMLQDMNSIIRISPPISTIIVSDASDLVLGHVTGGILTTTKLTDEQIISSAGSKSSTIRVNFYNMVDDGVSMLSTLQASFMIINQYT